MYEADVSYQGATRFKANFPNYEISIDFPKPDGSSSGTTPIHLLLGALASCIAVYLERYLVNAKIKFDNFSIKVSSEVSKEAPRYLRDINVKLKIEGADLDERRKKALLEFVKNCPVHNTLVNKPVVTINI